MYERKLELIFTCSCQAPLTVGNGFNCSGTYNIVLCIYYVLIRPGPNIPFNFPIIQIDILHLSTPLFNLLHVFLKKSWQNANETWIIMTRMYIYILANKCWITFSSKAKGTFSTPKNDRQLVIWAVCSSAFSVWSQTHVTWHKLSTHCVCTLLLEQLKSSLFNFFKKLPTIIQKIIQEYFAQA